MEKENFVKVEQDEGTIYDSVREGLQNELFRCQRLQEEGINTQVYQEQIIDNLKRLAEMDKQEGLANLRKELKHYE